MIVCKFGGSSISTSDNIKKIGDILEEKLKKNSVFAVFSAIGKTTDNLILCANNALLGIDKYINHYNELQSLHYNIAMDLGISEWAKHVFDEIESIFKEIDNILKGIYYIQDFSPRTKDKLLSFGENLSALIIHYYFYDRFKGNSLLMDAINYIKTDSNHNNAKPDFKKTESGVKQFIQRICNNDLIITSGFIGSDIDGNITTLGRGGGDYTAAIIGYCLNSEKVEIWTDVDGIMSSDPRKVKTAFNLQKITYKEMLELSHYGANVIYTPTITPLYNKKIPILIKNTNNPNLDGTQINYELVNRETIATAVSSIEDIAVLKIYGEYLIGKVGFTGKLFTHFLNNNINIILISQSSSEHSIYVVINLSDIKKTFSVLNMEYKYKIESQQLSIDYYTDKSIVAVETDNQNNIVKISGTIFPILENNKINVYTQATSDHNVCIVIDREYVTRALNLIHNCIFFPDIKNVFLFGCGLVGKELISQIVGIKNYRIVFIANSRKHLFDINGINNDWEERMINESKRGFLSKIVEKIIDSSLNNSIVVDCTSSDEIYPYYKSFLDNNIAVVTPNKKANTCEYMFFNTLCNYKNYKYETTVGAGLPIINTIKTLINSGDTIIKIEAVLSGTLSYIFNTFLDDTSKSFYEVVKDAEKLGYTEPNPKDDLTGMDVVRKILIISRLCKSNLEIDDVFNNQFLSKGCLDSDTKQEFYKNLEYFSKDMDDTRKFAIENNIKPKHIAVYENDQARVQLQGVKSDSPFYNLKGSDNMIIIKTKYYFDNPIVIRGPGAGAKVTASGVVGDMADV